MPVADDQAEEDDGPNTASEANDGRSYVNRIICPGNEDWYRIRLRRVKQSSQTSFLTT